jgi:Dullard-like phosphatase family protein
MSFNRPPSGGAGAGGTGSGTTLPPLVRSGAGTPVGGVRQSGGTSATQSPQGSARSLVLLHNNTSAGKESKDKDKDKDKDAGFSSARLTAARQATLANSKRAPIGQQLPADRGKLTVVLDVDETLIHSRLSSQQEGYRQAEERKVGAQALDEFTVRMADGELVHVNKRPGLDEFLRDASQHYELVAYTAGLEDYARPVLDALDPQNKYFRHRLYRDSCLFARGYYLKDLAKIGRPLGRIVLVDNNAFCFLPQLSNGIPISSFYDDPNDSALTVLTQFLERIKGEEDVRPFLKKSFNLETLLRDHRMAVLGA